MENIQFPKYGKIKALGHLENKDIFITDTDIIVLQEKIDGANFRFTILNGNIVFGSRTQQLTSDEGEDDNVAKGFRRCIDFVRDAVKDEDLSELHGLIFYGECCTRHTLEYDWDKLPPFIGFDVFDMKDETYFSSEDAKTTYESLGLTFVPILGKLTSKEVKEQGINDEFVPISKYPPVTRPQQQAEGIVFKNQTTGMYAKYVRNQFKEENSKVFGGSPKYNKDGDYDNDVITFKYCTNPRIEKIIMKKMDMGAELEMQMMSTLPHDVYEDIVEEHYKDIMYHKSWRIDFKGLRKMITTRCVCVLKQLITNNALGEKK